LGLEPGRGVCVVGWVGGFVRGGALAHTCPRVTEGLGRGEESVYVWGWVSVIECGGRGAPS